MELITPTTINKNQKNMKFLELLEKKEIAFDTEGNAIAVYEDLNLSYTPIKEFPNCPMIFYGDLNLSHTQIKKFPNNPMIVWGVLNISYTQIKELPDDWIVCESLIIRGTKITKLSNKLAVRDDILTPVKNNIYVSMHKDGIIEIGSKENSITGWEEFFKERKPFDNNPDLTHEDYDVVEQDFKTAVKLLKTWRS